MSRDLFRDETGAISPVLQAKVREEMAAKPPLGLLGQPSKKCCAMTRR